MSNIETRKSVNTTASIMMSDQEASLRETILNQKVQISELQNTITRQQATIDDLHAQLGRVNADVDNSDDIIMELRSELNRLQGEVQAYKFVVSEAFRQ